MWTRRQVLARGGLGVLGMVSATHGFSTVDEKPEPIEKIPDGSASRGMVTSNAEGAISRGLLYLAKGQNADGGFGLGNWSGNVAITSLGAMAFMAGGSQPQRGPHGATVTNALRFILNQAGKDPKYPGFLYNPFGSPNGALYGHGFGTLFLGEVYGMVHEPNSLREELRKKLKGAVDLIVESQNKEGGWRYKPDDGQADISATVCQIMALRSARNAGFAVPKPVVDKCVSYVKRCQDRRQGWFRYMPRINGHAHPFARTAAGLAALYSAGIYRGPEIESGLNYLMTCKPSGKHRGFQGDMYYFYGHYYAAQVMWTAGGNYWSEWFPAIREELLSFQQGEGYWEDRFSAHYGTAMACIILQIPNNYLPILQK